MKSEIRLISYFAITGFLYSFSFQVSKGLVYGTFNISILDSIVTGLLVGIVVLMNAFLTTIFRFKKKDFYKVMEMSKYFLKYLFVLFLIHLTGLIVLNNLPSEFDMMQGVSILFLTLLVIVIAGIIEVKVKEVRKAKRKIWEVIVPVVVLFLVFVFTTNLDPSNMALV